MTIRGGCDRSRERRIPGAILVTLVGAMLSLAACAPMAPQAPPKTQPGAPAPGTAQKPPATTPTRAAVDSTPSADALAVLGTIPEPLAAGERVPPPDVPVPSGTSVAPSVGGGADAGSGDVPVPATVPVLGERTNPALDAATDSTGADSAAARTVPPSSSAAGSSASGSPPASSGAPPKPAATSGPCWRVQFAAPTDRDEAEGRRKAAESLLLVPIVIETERGLHKVRTRDCYPRDAADRLRERAVQSGFDGAFPLGVPK